MGSFEQQRHVIMLILSWIHLSSVRRTIGTNECRALDTRQEPIDA